MIFLINKRNVISVPSPQGPPARNGSYIDDQLAVPVAADTVSNRGNDMHARRAACDQYIKAIWSAQLTIRRWAQM